MKFITVFDDEKQKLLYNDILKRYDISAYPSVYFADGKPYIDYLNSDSVLYYKHRADCDNISGPEIPVKVFRQAIKFAYDDGYSVLLIVCPSKKYCPSYYKNATTAAKNFYRNKNVDLTTFSIKVIDSKAIAAGHMYFALQLARLYNNLHCPSHVVIADSKNIISKALFLSASAEKFGFKNGELSAFRLYGNRLLRDINISDSSDYVRYDIFANVCAGYIKKAKGKYIVSVGANCTFSANIIGRIEKQLGYPPIATIQYGIVSSEVLGLETLCVNIV